MLTKLILAVIAGYLVRVSYTTLKNARSRTGQVIPGNDGITTPSREKADRSFIGQGMIVGAMVITIVVIVLAVLFGGTP